MTAQETRRPVRAAFRAAAVLVLGPRVDHSPALCDAQGCDAPEVAVCAQTRHAFLGLPTGAVTLTVWCPEHLEPAGWLRRTTDYFWLPTPGPLTWAQADAQTRTDTPPCTYCWGRYGPTTVACWDTEADPEDAEPACRACFTANAARWAQPQDGITYAQVPAVASWRAWTDAVVAAHPARLPLSPLSEVSEP